MTERRGVPPHDRHAKPRISPARLVAYDVLRDVTERDAYANLALPSRIRAASLDRRDAALATELAAGSLRGLVRYDRIVELAADRPIDHIDARTRNVLRLGVHQLLSMRTAAHAAVNESVELQRRVANRAAAGFVNGVLRTVGRADAGEWDQRIDEASRNADDSLAVRTSHPGWVLRALRDALRAEGRDDELEELLIADNAPPRVSLVVLPGSEYGERSRILRETDNGADVAASVDVIAEADNDVDRQLVAEGPSPLGVQLAGGDPAEAMSALGLPLGSVRVQDQGSQLAALALSRVKPVAAGERWLDLCAGPGGKAAVLGAEALIGGATLRANEVSEHRANLVRESVAAVAESVEVVSFDGRDDDAYGGAEARFDRILVDAPCSGLGALRRRPEARHRKQPGDLPVLTQLQIDLLDAAVTHLASGGVLAYVTCSPHLAETRVVLERLLRKHAGLVELDAKTVVNTVARSPLDLAGAQRSAQLWPHRHGTDAMFISLIQRTD